MNFLKYFIILNFIILSSAFGMESLKRKNYSTQDNFFKRFCSTQNKPFKKDKELDKIVFKHAAVIEELKKKILQKKRKVIASSKELENLPWTQSLVYLYLQFNEITDVNNPLVEAKLENKFQKEEIHLFKKYIFEFSKILENSIESNWFTSKEDAKMAPLIRCFEKERQNLDKVFLYSASNRTSVLLYDIYSRFFQKLFLGNRGICFRAEDTFVNGIKNISDFINRMMDVQKASFSDENNQQSFSDDEAPFRMGALPANICVTSNWLEDNGESSIEYFFNDTAVNPIDFENLFQRFLSLFYLIETESMKETLNKLQQVAGSRLFQIMMSPDCVNDVCYLCEPFGKGVYFPPENKEHYGSVLDVVKDLRQKELHTLKLYASHNDQEYQSRLLLHPSVFNNPHVEVFQYWDAKHEEKDKTAYYLGIDTLAEELVSQFYENCCQISSHKIFRTGPLFPLQQLQKCIYAGQKDIDIYYAKKPSDDEACLCFW